MELVCEYPNCDEKKAGSDMNQRIELMKMHIGGKHTTTTTNTTMGGVKEE